MENSINEYLKTLIIKHQTQGPMFKALVPVINSSDFDNEFEAVLGYYPNKLLPEQFRNKPFSEETKSVLETNFVLACKGELIKSCL